MLDAAVRDRAVYLRAADALVLADLHVGRDEASAVALPLGERADLAERLDALITEFDPSTVVFAGDVLHRFDRVSLAAAETVAALVEACEAAGARPVAVAGNHDARLSTVWDGDVRDAVELDDGTVVCHGHEVPDAVDAATPDDRPALLVCGHDHPAVTIEGRRRPCVLYGPGTDRAADLLMLPAFTRLAAGATVGGMDTASFQSPLVTDADALRVLVRDAEAGETLTFPPLGELRRLL